MAGIGGICVAVGLFAYAPSASASTVSADALAHVAYGGTASSGLEWAGTVVDPALGNGGLLATFGRTAAGYRGTATMVNPNGSLTATVQVTVHLEGHLVRFGVAADVTGATGRFTGARAFGTWTVASWAPS